MLSFNEKHAEDAVVTKKQEAVAAVAAASPPVQVLLEAEVRRRLGGIVHSTLWRWIRKKQFPAPIKLGPGRKIAWFESDIDTYLASRPIAPAYRGAATAGRDGERV